MSPELIASLIQALMVLLPSGYLVLSLLYAMSFTGEAEPSIERFRTPLLRLLFVLHIGLFTLHGIAVDGVPTLDRWLSFSAVALGVVALFVGITLNHRQPTVGALVLLVAGVMQMLASMFGSMTQLTAGGASHGATTAHVLTAVIACASIVISGLYGFLYLVLLRQMKRQAFGAVFQRLPDLTQLATMTRRAALAGFIGLALGVNVGIALAHATKTIGFSYTDPTVLLTMGVWLHFGLIAFSRKIPGLTAQRASWASVAGLTVLLGIFLLAVVPGATFHALR